MELGKQVMPSTDTKKDDAMKQGCFPTQPAWVGIRFVARFFGCSTRHIHRLWKSGNFPQPHRLGHALRWRREEIENFQPGEATSTSDEQKAALEDPVQQIIDTVERHGYDLKRGSELPAKGGDE